MSMGATLDDRLPAGAPSIGDVFAQKYRIERVLGMGGMGYVLAATHIHLDERVAIKMLLPELLTHAETVQRFLREGRAAVKIRSEHVGRVIDVATDNGVPYMVMEYLDGCDLAALLRSSGRLPVMLAVDYVLEACEAVAEAHAMGTVHRDLKPSNLFVAKRPNGQDCIKVLDFGISKMTLPAGSEQFALTRTSATIGSPLYMSPEQLRSSKTVDTRSDIWALGVILFELLAGRPPFLADTLPELGALVLSGHAPDVRQLAANTPPGLAAVIATCLERDALDRFPSCAEFALAIAPFGSPAAHASARTVAQVLESVPRPSTQWTTARLAQHSPSGPPPQSSGTQGQGATLAITPPSLPVQTAGTWGSATGGPSASPGRGTIGLAIAGALTLLVAGFAMNAWVVPRLRPKPVAASGTASAEAASRAPQASADAPTTPQASAPPAALASSVPLAETSADAAAAIVEAGAPAAPIASARLPAAPARAPINDNCKRPFEIDATGKKRWKPECL